MAERFIALCPDDQREVLEQVRQTTGRPTQACAEIEARANATASI